MKLLITGFKGQLGWELVRLSKAHRHDIFTVDLPDVSIADKQQIESAASAFNPDIIINAAAYTHVDNAEKEPDIAYAVNRDGSANLAGICFEKKIPLIHISTDYVFNGENTVPYKETDPVSPLGVYGKSKMEGERRIRDILENHLIIRTAWLYGVHGHNFVKTMLKLGKEHETIRVVSDQQGSPTCAADLAAAVMAMIRHCRSSTAVEWGTYHFCGAGITTWHGFTEQIIRIARPLISLKVKEVLPITTDQYPTPAPRPAFSALDCTKIQTFFNISPPQWRESLKTTLKKMLTRA